MAFRHANVLRMNATTSTAAAGGRTRSVHLNVGVQDAWITHSLRRSPVRFKTSASSPSTLIANLLFISIIFELST